MTSELGHKNLKVSLKARVLEHGRPSPTLSEVLDKEYRWFKKGHGDNLHQGLPTKTQKGRG